MVANSGLLVIARKKVPGQTIKNFPGQVRLPVSLCSDRAFCSQVVESNIVCMIRRRGLKAMALKGAALIGVAMVGTAAGAMAMGALAIGAKGSSTYVGR